jgi:subtilisin family serine protease
MSLAGILNNTTFDDAITASVAAGITYAVAAGNDGADAAAYSPANHPDVITVSALPTATERPADGGSSSTGPARRTARWPPSPTTERRLISPPRE